MNREALRAVNVFEYLYLAADQPHISVLIHIDVSVFILQIAVVRVGMQEDLRFIAGKRRFGLIAAVVMVVGALPFFHAAAKFVIPLVTLVGMDMSPFEDIALLIQDRLGGQLADQVSADGRIAVRSMLMPVRLGKAADKHSSGGVTIFGVPVGLDLRQRADKMPVAVVAVVVVDMDEEVGTGCTRRRYGRAGELSHLVRLRGCREMEDPGDPGGYQQAHANQQRKLPLLFFHLAQSHRDLVFPPVVHLSPPLRLFPDLIIADSPSIKASIRTGFFFCF